jgi:phosphinothricin acetyltransferase
MAERAGPPGIELRPMCEADAGPVLAIYAEGIATGHATFQDEAGDWACWSAGHLAACRLVAHEGGRLLGWAGLSAVSDRCVYGGVAEVSVYVADAARGRGVGKALLGALVGGSEQAGIWTLQAGIFPENAASVALHRKAGFEVVGTRRGLGRMTHGPLAGRWRDVLLLERRSASVGVD